MKSVIAAILACWGCSLWSAVGDAYVSQVSVSSVAVVDTTTNTVIGGFVPTGMHPTFEVATPDGQKVYVGSVDGSVTVIRTADNTPIATLPLGGAGILDILITPDGTKVYAANLSGYVSCIRTSDDMVIAASIGVGLNPKFMCALPDSSQIWVPCEGSNAVYIIETSSNTVLGLPVLTDNLPQSAASTPDGKEVYVACLSGFVDVIHVASHSVTPIVTGPGGAFFVRIGNGSAFATNPGNDSITAIDLITHATTIIPTGAQSQFLEITPDGSRVYVVNTFDGIGGNSVTVVETAFPYNVVTTVPVGHEPIMVAFPSDGSRAYVTNHTSGSVSVIDTATFGVTTITGFDLGPFDIIIAATPTVVVRGEQIRNVFLFQRELVNVIHWSAPEGIIPTGYQIYRDAGLLQLAGTTPASGPLVFYDRNRQPNTVYTYFVVATTATTSFVIGSVTVDPIP